jgi:probable HAF family extracellular repeat protein
MVALGAVPHEINWLIWPFECRNYTYPTGIALNGNIVGSNRDFDTYIDGFLWTRGAGFTGVGGGYQSRVNAVNNDGVMVGEIGQPMTHNDHAMLWKKGSPLSPIDLGTLGGESKLICSAATSINDLHQVVGWSGHNEVTCIGLYAPYDAMHAFLWTQAQGMQDLGALPGDDSSMAIKINLFGQVVGISGKSNAFEDEIWDEDGRRVLAGRPFVWSQRKGMRDLNDLIRKNSGWTLQTAADINLWGQIIGVGSFRGQKHGYLLTPKVLFDF